MTDPYAGFVKAVEKVCYQCGHKNPDQAFCAACGSPLDLNAYILRTTKDQLTHKTKERKDGWEKAAIVGQLLSGVLIGALGFFINMEFGRTQRALSSDQLELAQRTEVSNYVKEIATQTGIDERAELLSALDIAIPPEQAIPIAMHYAAKTRTCDPSTARPVFDRSLQVLQRIREKGIKQLREIAHGPTRPDSDMAGALLNEDISVRVRVSQVNRFSDLQINGKSLPPFKLSFGKDSGWIDITSNLHAGEPHNTIVLVVDCSARLEVSAGTQQFDSALIQVPCVAGSPQSYISGSMQVEALHAKDESVKLFMGSGNYHPNVLEQGCKE